MKTKTRVVKKSTRAKSKRSAIERVEKLKPDALVRLDPVASSQLVMQENSTRAAQHLAQAQLIKVIDEPTLLRANDGLGRIKQELERLETARKALVQPLNIHVKNINAQFAPLTAQLEQANALLRQKVIAFRNEADARAEAEQAKKLAAAEKAQAAGDDAKAERLATEAASIQTIPSTLSSAQGSVSMRKRWSFEVRDRNLIPPQYLIVDETAIRRAISSGVREISGLLIFERDELAVSA